MTRPKAQARAIAKRTDNRLKWIGGGMLALGALALADRALADGHEEITVTHAYSNFGEIKYPADFPHLDYVNPDAPKGGEIATWGLGTFDSFNRYTREGTPAALGTIFYEEILVGTADDPYGTYCYLCTTMEYPESRDWVIFNLRDDVKFWDGSTWTAEDAKFAFDLVMEQGIAEYRNAVGSYIESVEVLDEFRVKFNFTPEAPRRDVIGVAGSTNAWSKAWFEETGASLSEPHAEPFLATGAYKLAEVDFGRNYVLERDPNHWGAAHPLNIGQNNFDRIRVEYFADSAAAMEGFKAGEYTLRVENSSKEWATGYEFPNLENGYVIRAQLPDGTLGSGQSYVFNLDRPTWQDRRVREAIGMMFNFEWSNESLFYGLYERTTGFWQNGGDLEATGTPTDAEVAILQPLVDEGLFPASILTDEVVMPPVNEAADNAPGRRTMRAAVALMEEAGWVSGDDGLLRNEAGETMELTILSFSPAFDRIHNPFIENLRQLGVDAVLDRVDSSQYVERRRSGDFDLVNHSPGQGFEPGSGLKQWFASSTADDSSRNMMRLRNPGVDKLVDVIVAAEDFDEMAAGARALDRVLRAELFWVPQWQKAEYWVAYYDQFDYPEPLPPFALGELSFWWYDAEGAERLRAEGVLQ